MLWREYTLTRWVILTLGYTGFELVILNWWQGVGKTRALITLAQIVMFISHEDHKNWDISFIKFLQTSTYVSSSLLLYKLKKRERTSLYPWEKVRIFYGLQATWQVARYSNWIAFETWIIRIPSANQTWSSKSHGRFVGFDLHNDVASLVADARVDVKCDPDTSLMSTLISWLWNNWMGGVTGALGDINRCGFVTK